MRHSACHPLTFLALAVFSISLRAPASSPTSWIQRFQLFTLKDTTPLSLKPRVAFADDADSGASDILKPRLEYPSTELLKKCGFTLDMMRNESLPGMYGPTSLLMSEIGQRSDDGETELLPLGTEGRPLTDGSLLHSETLEPSHYMPEMFPRLSPVEGMKNPADADPHPFGPDIHLEDIHGLGFQTKSSLAPLMMVAVMVVLARVRRTRLIAD